MAKDGTTTRPPAARMVASLALGLLGAGLWLLSQGQPSRLDGAIGPGFMARGLALGVVGLAAVWALTLWHTGRGARRPTWPPPEHTPDGTARPAAALPLLAGVLGFALVVPTAGLVVGAALAAGAAAWATGERRPGALAATAGLLGALTATIGVTLLPPTAPLWPGG